MPSFFVNRDGSPNRRSIRSVQGQQVGPSTVKELMLLPSFDTFIFHNPSGACGGDRWNFLPNGNNPNNSQEIPVGLFNPWNDGYDAPYDSKQAPRTPTRAVFAFDMRGLNPGANIISADLVLTVARSNNWMSDDQQNRAPLFQYVQNLNEQKLPVIPSDLYGELITIVNQQSDQAQEILYNIPWYNPDAFPSVIPWDGRTIIDGYRPCFWWRPGYSPSQSQQHPDHPPGKPVPSLQVPTIDPIEAGACPTYVSWECIECINYDVFCNSCTLIFRHENRWWVYSKGKFYFIGDWYNSANSSRGNRLIPYVPGLGVPVNCYLDIYPGDLFPGGVPVGGPRGLPIEWIYNPNQNPGTGWYNASNNECEKLLGWTGAGFTGTPLLF